MKKAISILAIVILISCTISVTAFARGHHGNGGRVRQQQPQYELCTVDGCTALGIHQHGDNWYCCQTGDQCGYGYGNAGGCCRR